MDGTRPGPLSDASLDRALDDALNVEPSPEFVARVRLRVAAEPRAMSWRGSWRLAGAGAAVAAMAVMTMIAVAVWPAARSTESGPAAIQVSGAPRAAVDSPAAFPPQRTPAPQPAAPGGIGLRSGRAAAPGSAAAIDPEPPSTAGGADGDVASAQVGSRPPFEVLISTDEVRAYEMLFTRVPVQARATAPPGSTRPDRVERVELRDLAITSLTIEPRPLMALLETGERP